MYVCTRARAHTHTHTHTQVIYDSLKRLVAEAVLQWQGVEDDDVTADVTDAITNAHQVTTAADVATAAQAPALPLKVFPEYVAHTN